MGRIGVGVQEADSDRLHLELDEATGRVAHAGLVLRTAREVTRDDPADVVYNVLIGAPSDPTEYAYVVFRAERHPDVYPAE